MEGRLLAEARKQCETPRTGVIGGCVLPDVGAVAWTQVLYKSGMHSLIVELSR